MGRGWRWDKLADVLPTLTLMKLAGNGMDLEVETTDRVGWLSSSGKKFSISFAYKLEAKWNSVDRLVGWKLIWMLRVAQRVRVFIWQSTLDRLSTNVFRRRMRLSSS